MSKKTETEQPQPSATAEPAKPEAASHQPGQVVPAPATEAEAAQTENFKMVDNNIAYCNEILEVCQLAGKMNLAKDFISKKTSVAQVRTALLEQRVQEDEALSVVGSHEVPKVEKTSAAQVEPVASVFSRWQTEMNGKKA